MNELNDFLNISEKQKDFILNNIISSNINIKNTIDITSNVFNDISIDNWVNSLPTLKGSKKLIDYLIKNPVNDKELLINRQKSNINLREEFKELKKYEDNVLWLYTLNDEIDKDLSINLLYPSTYLINRLNNYKLFLDIYHPYKIFMVPFMSLFYPISFLFTPFFYMRKYLNSKMTIFEYFKIIRMFLKFFFTNTGNIRRDIIKLLTLFMYIGIYIYSIYQTFEISYIIYKTRCKLVEKMKGLCLFINKSVDIINSLDIKEWDCFYLYDIYKLRYNPLFKINNTMNDIYKLWKNNNIKNEITDILKIIYTIDIANSINSLKKSKNWTKPIYIDDNDIQTKLWNMKNPLLSDNQQKNPTDLSKNIIITGPNAAGKTTYIKTIITNIILSQTFGIVNSLKAQINIYDSIHSFMRINDVLGSKSYFEAETECCSNMIKMAVDINKNNKKALLFMDEPMHSTPPTEGVSVAFAVAEYLSKLKGITLIITTHYHKLINLEKKYPDLFINLCVNALYDKDNNKYLFDYKISKGFSNQCIAIELLEKQKFPLEVIDSAIYLKNKICTNYIAVNNDTFF